MGELQGRRVAVIGAGIGGLVAAIALARRGASVTVHERAPALTEVGAGIQLSANAVRVLDALGLGPALRSVALRNRAVQLNDAAGRRVLRMDLQTHRPDADFLLIHRPRLIGILTDAGRSAGVRIELGQQVEDMPDTPLVIGADGLGGRSRGWLNGREVPFFTGQTAWRAVIPGDGPPEAHVFMGPGRHLVSYPLGRGLRNIVAVEERRDWQDEGWSHEGDPDDLRRAFAGFGGRAGEWLSQVDRVNLWGLFRHEIARRWTGDRLAILGDAAHPTLPFLAQGAGMAIEDAWVLASCLDAAPQPDALAAYQAARVPRVTRIVQAANANARNYHLNGPKRLAGHLALRIADRVAPRLMPGRFDWLYDYNPVAAHP
ncbi:FAD-dependent monooxygenase [Paracoccus sp. 1_MG-2023]|uniref:FAD-dependent monooxygenase n=1 Tax=unclassified Paracoccus (in: a-proteobacteria) TaxID=2688777 RepID=UPI001C08F5F9|nr:MULTISPECIES: FAD-dependent monooxygenase [unclassified Paracoccus (in: a-proteobacteria)]MBU2956703.1 FAD-dependent monooxygenase [Paracoccus sp. C2R09]MDO6669257.1 FAD-dependent monooxygenase [Paracoccus sp. 1_MG-2023]